MTGRAPQVPHDATPARISRHHLSTENAFPSLALILFSFPTRQNPQRHLIKITLK
jgi:hypothetical protein